MTATAAGALDGPGNGAVAGSADGRGTYAGGPWSWITTVDHKRIGILYFVTALLFFVLAGVEALLIRAQLATPDGTILDPDLYNQLFTMHGLTMVFLAGMPLSVAFFNFVVPLQIGARDVAFPRLNAFSYWMFLFGGLFLYSSFLFGGAPDVGWFAYAPLTLPEYSPGYRMEFYYLGLQLAGIGTIAGGVNFFVTILNLRAPGMKLMRMPVFTWMTFVTSILILLAFPPLTVALVFLMFDRLFGTAFFVAAAGGDPLLWQHLFWIFGHPEVYILVLPAFGIISDVVPTFSKKTLFGYPVVVYAGILIAFLGFGVWVHHMFAVGLGPIANSIFAASTMLIAVPTGVKIFNWLATMWGGAVRFRTPMLFAIGLIAVFVIGGISGIMHASPPHDLQQTDTYFVVAHLHYVLFGGTMFGLFAGTYYWFPKVTGRMYHEGLGKWHFWLTLIGVNLTFFPMHFSGLLGMPRRTFTYHAELGVEGFNLVSTVGAFLLGGATLLLVWNLVRSARRGPPAGPNPWDAPTLEWAADSPPAHYNFATIPEVSGREPLWGRYHAARGEDEAAREEGEVTIAGQKVGEVEVEGEGPGGRGPEAREEEIHMPDPSFWPLVVALGLLTAASGVLLGLTLVLAGAGIALLGIFAWAFEPAGH